MCDYSLMSIPNRLAVAGEDLVMHRFLEGTMGMASASDLRLREERRQAVGRGFWARVKEFFSAEEEVPAVCIPPGTRLIVRDIPANLQFGCSLRGDYEEAIFTQLTAAIDTFRDAVRFNNGSEVLLNRFAEGQRVRVLDVSSGEERETSPRELVRVG
jgi:hypothetical protein